MDRLHETGIIGSLRWWYEVIVRGLGGEACDPTQHPCVLDSATYQQSGAETLGLKLHEAGLCDACQVFGATGWKRRFRLSVEQSEMAPAGPDKPEETTGDRFTKGGQKHPRWYFKGQGRGGKLQITITSLNPDFDPYLLFGPLTLIGKYGGLAAKTQLGYGWITFQPPADFEAAKVLSALPITPTTPDPDLPSLQNMFFTEVETGEAGMTATLNAKYDVREIFRTTFDNTNLRHFICGTVRGERQASKIFFSQGVQGKMRVWGWVPQALPVEDLDRDEVVGAIHKTLSGIGKLSYWREFDSPRNSICPSKTDRLSFVRSLFEEAL